MICKHLISNSTQHLRPIHWATSSQLNEERAGIVQPVCARVPDPSLSADPNEIEIVGQKHGVSNQENVETGWKKQSLRGFRKVKFSKESVQDGMKPADNTDQMNALDNPVNRNLLKIAGYPNNHPARTDLFIP